jgi:hypothetical protein
MKRMTTELGNSLGEQLLLASEHWAFLLDAAVAHGWQPQGSRPPNRPRAQPWDGHYRNVELAYVDSDDVADMILALQCAEAAIEQGSGQGVPRCAVGPHVDDPDQHPFVSPEDPRRLLFRRFVDFAEFQALKILDRKCLHRGGGPTRAEWATRARGESIRKGGWGCPWPRQARDPGGIRRPPLIAA